MRQIGTQVPPAPEPWGAGIVRFPRKITAIFTHRQIPRGEIQIRVPDEDEHPFIWAQDLPYAFIERREAIDGKLAARPSDVIGS